MSPFRKHLRWLTAALCLFVAVSYSYALGHSTEADHPAPGADRPAPKPRQALATFEAAWKIVYETHWDTNFNGVDWRAVRAELRPKAESAATVRELRAVIEEMLSRLGQSHMALIPSEVADAFDPERLKKSETSSSSSGSKGDGGNEQTNKAEQRSDADDSSDAEKDGAFRDRDGEVGFDVRLVDGRVVVARVEPGSPAEAAGVKAGWVITAVGKTSMTERLQKLTSEVESQHAHFMAWRMATALLAGKPDSTAQLEFLNGENQPVPLEIVRRRTKGEPIKLGLLPTFFARLDSQRLNTPDGATVGLIRFNVWMPPLGGALEKAVDEFRDADGMVIDLRGNLGGIGGMIMGVAGHFLKERVSLGTMKMRSTAIKFFANPRLVNQAGRRVVPFAGPLAVLVDGVTLSASEIFAGGMQDIGRARIFGATSPGQALPAVWDRLPNGDVLYHAFADFVTASGVRLEGRGVIPDQVLPLTREDLLAGRDAALQSALAWISKQRQKLAPKDSAKSIGGPEMSR